MNRKIRRIPYIGAPFFYNIMNDDVDFCLVTMFSLAKAEKKEKKKKKCCPWWRDAFFSFPFAMDGCCWASSSSFHNIQHNIQGTAGRPGTWPFSFFFLFFYEKNRPSPHFVSVCPFFFFGCWALKKSNIRQHLFIIYENSADSFSFFFFFSKTRIIFRLIKTRIDSIP